jgi:hypothetical protein
MCRNIFFFRQYDLDGTTFTDLPEHATQANIQLSALKIKQLGCVERVQAILTQFQKRRDKDSLLTQ